MRQVATQSLVIIGSLLAMPAVASRDASATPDVRTVRLQTFFSDRDCPIEHLAADFIQAADENKLDWRLLPSISFVESGGGKRKKNNNVFGWDNANRRFPSIRHGIYVVAHKLARSRAYRNKNLDQILLTYNPHPEYSRNVRRVMARMGPRHIGTVN